METTLHLVGQEVADVHGELLTLSHQLHLRAWGSGDIGDLGPGG